LSDKTFKIIDTYIESTIYVYIVFMFLSKGEGIRNIILFGNLGLWLLSIRSRKDLHLFKKPFFFFFCAFLGSSVLSAALSIDPRYSFSQLLGDPLKALLIFPVFATVLADAQRLRRAAYACLIAALVIMLNGYYSYLFGHTEVLKPHTWLMKVWYNRFSSYMNILLPFAFILFFFWKKPGQRALLMLFFFFAVLALILNATRTGLLEFAVIAAIWLVYLATAKKYRLTKAVVTLTFCVFLAASLAWGISPWVREKAMRTRSDLPTLNYRTVGWSAALYAFMERPIEGWGYGETIFQMDEPFRNTPIKTHPLIETPHNTFFTVMFHQGTVGIIPYVLIIGWACVAFWKEAVRGTGIRSYVLMACFSVVVGNYIIYAFFNPAKFHHLTVILGIGMAAVNLHEDRGP
jgi:O-antigen ligase